MVKLVRPNIANWSFLCPVCENKTYAVLNTSESVFDAHVPDPRGDYTQIDRYLRVRLIECSNCEKPFVIGTHSYRSENFDVWRQGEELASEYFAFQSPEQQPQLPVTTPKEVRDAVREGVFALSHRKQLSAGAMIRTAIDRLLSHENIPDSGGMEQRIEQLDIDDELRKDLAQLNIVGREVLHVEKYSVSELKNAMLVLLEVIREIYGKRERRAELHKAISSKASSRAKKQTK